MRNIVAHYNEKKDKKIRISDLNRTYDSWEDFRKFCIESYSGEQVDMGIFCWNATPEEMQRITEKKADLVGRIANNCKIPDREKCDIGCPMNC